MPYTLSQQPNTNIITVTYRGDVGLDERLRAVTEVCDMLKKEQVVRLLIDVREIVNNLMSAPEQQYFGQYLAEKPEFNHAKVAVLSAHLTHNPNLQINDVAFDNGYHLAPFTSKDEAISWLDDR